MELNPEVYAKMKVIDWFSNCGHMPLGGIPFQYQQLADVPTAVANALSSNWQDAGTAAQGELTRYLAKTDYESYGTSWNRLARASRELIQRDVMPTVTKALAKVSATELSHIVLLDLNRIAIRSAFASRHKRTPDFFERLLVVYERGHLPCGWVGDLDTWPEGTLIVL